MADHHVTNDQRSPRIEDGYGTDAVEPAGWPRTIEEEVDALHAQAAAEQLAQMPTRGRA